MHTPAEAEGLIRDHLPPFQREDCPVASAHGRVLRTELRADRDLPPFDRVTMDGFALRSADWKAGTRQFTVAAVQAAGMRAFELGADVGACIEVMTGAVLPIGADCVVPNEAMRREGTTVRLTVTGVVEPGQAVHRKGGDHRAGEVIVPAGVRVTGREVAVAAACGVPVLAVSRLPRIAVIATGDELVEVDAPVAPHLLRRSNDYALRAALLASGYPVVERFHFRDIRDEIEHLLWHIVAEFDVIVLTGGVSKGKFDYLPSELERQGVSKIFHRIGQCPGKPLWFGMSSRQTPIFALPGNPVSAYTCLHRYVLPALAEAAGLPPPKCRLVALAESVVFRPKLARLLPVRLHSGPGAVLLASPQPTNTSGDFAGLVGTDGFVELPPEPEEFVSGTIAPFHPWI
jgi:molybdopterin molybdotransferase